MLVSNSDSWTNLFELKFEIYLHHEWFKEFDTGVDTDSRKEDNSH